MSREKELLDLFREDPKKEWLRTVFNTCKKCIAIAFLIYLFVNYIRVGVFCVVVYLIREHRRDKYCKKIGYVPLTYRKED